METMAAGIAVIKEPVCRYKDSEKAMQKAGVDYADQSVYEQIYDCVYGFCEENTS